MNKNVVVFFMILSTLTYGFEIKGVVGLNYQTYSKTIENTTISSNGSGVGTHIGLGAGIDLTPGCLPAVLMLETGVWIQNANYKWKVGSIEYEEHYLNFVIPIVPKIVVSPPMTGFSLGFGIGPTILSNLSGTARTRIGEGPWSESKLSKEDLKTFLCFRLQGEMGFRVAPMVWVSPYFIIQPNLTADDPDTDSKESRSYTLLGFSLIFRI